MNAKHGCKCKTVIPNRPSTIIIMQILTIQLFIATIHASSPLHGISNPIMIGMRSAMMTSSSSPPNAIKSFAYSSIYNRSNGSRRRFHQHQKLGIEQNDESEDVDCDYDSNVLFTSNSQIQPTTTTLSSSSTTHKPTTTARGGGKAPTEAPRLNFWENMICGAVSRSVAQTATHPANVMKTILQSNRSSNRLTIREIAKVKNLKMLSRGAGAQLILSIPHGAVNFAVLEYVRNRIGLLADKSEWAMKQKENNATFFGPAMDFLSSAVATVCCSVVSTPQMMVVDNIMAGTYPNLVKAVQGLSAQNGVSGFYSGWWPGLAGKIPSYALTWTLFQQLKQLQLKVYQRPPKDIENSIMGCMASATSVCILIPMDTIKTRLVTQLNYPDLVPYKGIIDAAVRITREEGIGTFYRGLPPRLISVVPMVGIQFGTYEFMKKVMLSRRSVEMKKVTRKAVIPEKDEEKMHRIESVIMEVAADDDQPFPVPTLRDYKKEVNKKEPEILRKKVNKK